jgi:hypothetical protein
MAAHITIDNLSFLHYLVIHMEIESWLPMPSSKPG